MSTKHYRKRERDRRVATALSYIKEREQGVALQLAPTDIASHPAMQTVTPDTVRIYLFELMEQGLIFLDSEGCLKATPAVSEKVKVWLKNGDTQ